MRVLLRPMLLALVLLPGLLSAAEIRLREHDSRGNGEDSGAVAALSASHSAVVVKIHTDNAALLAEIREAMRRLIAEGFNRIGLIRADGDPDLLEIFAGGLPFASIEDVARGAGPDLELALREGVIKGYEYGELPKRSVVGTTQGRGAPGSRP